MQKPVILRASTFSALHRGKRFAKPAMGSHIYEFGGKLFLQLFGGPIGSNFTAWLASIVMKAFDNLWETLLIANEIIFLV